MHRDVKLANCLVAPDGSVRLADFGHAAILCSTSEAAADRRLHDKVGTKSFCAPEIIACGAEGYDGPPTDVWSAGVCFFALLSGRLPFAIAEEGSDWRYAKVLAAQEAGGSTTATIHEWLQRPVHWSEAAVEFVDGLLLASPSTRPTATAALAVGWLASAGSRMTRSRSGTIRSGASQPSDEAHRRSQRSAQSASLGGGSLGRVGPASRVGVAGRRSAELSCSAASGVLTRSRSREVSMRDPLASHGLPTPTTEDVDTVTKVGRDVQDPALPVLQSTARSWVRGGTSTSHCTRAGREGSPGARRKRSMAEEQEERTCVWRGLAEHLASRPEMQSAAGYPSSSLRYRNLQHVIDDDNPTVQWMHGTGSRLPVVEYLEVDRPFKSAAANNNSCVLPSPCRIALSATH